MSHRLQVTLEDHQYRTLAAASESSGASIAELVRQAIDARFGSDKDRSARFIAALSEASGVWADRPDDGRAYQRVARTTLAARPPAR
jgi:hypothetical protein